MNQEKNPSSGAAAPGSDAGGACSAANCGACSADCDAAGASEVQAPNLPLNTIRNKIMVMSGKGGVGKSTVSVNLAVALALKGRSVGLLDVDIHGPSIPKMLRLEAAEVQAVEGRIQPVEFAGVKMMSIGLLLSDRNAPVIWRGPLKMGAIKQFIEEVEWGNLDYLIIDAPPGTGDEPLSVCQLAAPLTGAVVVTTPQDISTSDVRRSISFCSQLEIPVLGVVENMSGFVCPHCSKTTAIFKSGGGESLAEEMGVPFLGRIPIDPNVGESCDAGLPFVYHYSKTETAKAFAKITEPLLALSHGEADSVTTAKKGALANMKIAIPLAEGKLSLHFGHCEQFALVDVDPEAKTIKGTELTKPPPHEPGVLPKWLHELGATVIIAGGMGQRAQELFKQSEIEVVVGATSDTPENLVTQYLAGTLTTGANVCDH